MKTLQDIWKELADTGYETDKGSVHDYITVYEDILKPYRGIAKYVLEIGLFNGHSMRLWEQYFTNAEVHGIDCDEQPHGGMADLRPMIKEDVHHIHIMDAGDKDSVRKTFGRKKFNIIIEDSSHEISHQLQLINVWYEYLANGGLLIVEDIQNLDKDYHVFEKLLSDGFDVTIIDRREYNNRYDNALVIIKK